MKKRLIKITKLWKEVYVINFASKKRKQKKLNRKRKQNRRKKKVENCTGHEIQDIKTRYQRFNRDTKTIEHSKTM